jgi:hypothetical protein
LFDSIFKQPGRFSCRAVIASQTPSFRDDPQDQTSDAQLRIGESRDSGFDASHRPGMTEPGSLPLRNDFKLKSSYGFAFPRREAPELLIYLSPQTRAWGMPDARCTRALVCNYSDRTHTSNNEYTGITRHSRTQWFYDLLRALPGDRAFLPPSPREICLSRPVGAI